MKLTHLYLVLAAFLFTHSIKAQCFEIESILVDACGPQEGLNEMVRFKIGPAPLNTSNLVVNWPNNAWQGLIQNAFTASQTAALNTQVINAGGCAQLLEPTGGVLPANSTVILITSFNVSTEQNPFGAISEDIYVLYQNNPSNGNGHFANFGVGIRTLTMSFGSCFDIVSYDRSLLVDQNGEIGPGDGATVLYDPAGNPTYVNFGCFAPVPPFLVNIEEDAVSGCAGTSVSLSATAEGQQSLLWSSAVGTFSDTTILNPTFTIPEDAVDTIVLTLTATDACGNTTSDTIEINLTDPVVPDFETTIQICSGGSVPELNTTSPNGISGTWNPATINQDVPGDYTFTPQPGQCATEVTITVELGSIPAPTGEALQLICYTETPTVSDLLAEGSNIAWYETATGGAPLDPSTPLSECQVYFASQTVDGCESDDRFPVTVILIQSQITASDNNICQGTSVTLTVPEISMSMPPFSILDFSANYNCNPSSSNFSGSTLLTQAQSGNIEFNGVPFYIHPWSNTLNSWSARYASGPNPRTLVLEQECALITDFSLFANTYWGSAGLPSYLNVSFYNNNQLVYVKELIGNEDIRDFNNSASYTSTINNTTTVNYWTSDNSSRRLDRITIPLPTPMAVDRIEINDSGATNLQRVFVLATTIHNFQPTVTYEWSTGETSTSITVTPTETTEYWVDITVNGLTCREFFTVTVADNIIPVFTQVPPICQGASFAALPTVSNNDISGSWSPEPNTTETTTYTFTPGEGQCADSVTMTIEVNPLATPTFDPVAPVCFGTPLANLPTVSNNGITGSWSPELDNTTTTTYTFTPTDGQCATQVTLTLEITEPITPVFEPVAPVCTGISNNPLPIVSGNGISGSWSPAFNNAETTTYTFTPADGQCAAQVTLTVEVNPLATPTFDAVPSVCSGATLTELPTLSNNGISGSWSPALNNTATTTYTFIPAPGQCASEATLTIFVNDFPQFSISEGCVGLQYTLTTEDVSNVENVTYTWLNSAGIEIGSGESVVVTASGTYRLIVTQNGCSDELELFVSSALCEIQRGISPNNDQQNDNFDLSNFNVRELQIFNRYGTQVYTKANYSNEWFGQSNNGKELPDGTYFYVIHFQDEASKTGWIYINREY